MNKQWLLLICVLSLSSLEGIKISHFSLGVYAQELQTPKSRLNQALTDYKAGQYQEAIASLTRLLNDPQVQQDRLLLGQLWNYLALSQQKLYQWDDAAQSITKSLEYLTPNSQFKTTLAHQQSYAQALTTQGQLYLDLGNDANAMDSWQQSERLYQNLGDNIGVQGSLLNQALALEQGGFYRRACFTLLESVQVESRCDFSEASPETIRTIFAAFKRLENTHIQVISLHTFSKILLQLGELDLASTALQAAEAPVQNAPQMQQRIRFAKASLTVAQYQALKQEETRARSRRIAQGLQTRVITQATQAEQNYDQLLNVLELAGDSQALVRYQAQVDTLTFLVDYSAWLDMQQRESDSEYQQIHELIEQLQSRSQPHVFNRAANFAHIKQAEALITLFQRDKTQYLSLKPQIIDLLQQVIQSTPASTFASDAVEAQTKAFANGTLAHFYEVQQQWTEAERLTQLALSHSQSVQNAEFSYRWQWQLGRILAAQGQRDPAIQAYEQALITLQAIRKDLLSLNRDAQFSFRDQIEPSYRQLVSLLLSDPNPDNQSLSTARQVIDRLQVSEVEDFLLQNCINASLASLDSYIERESPSSALVYTIIQDDYLDVIVKIPNTDTIQFHRVNQSKPQVEEFLKNYRRSLQQKLPSTKRYSKTQGNQLYQWLIEPFQSEFQQQNIETLIFVLDGTLRDIPMATLHDGQRYLIEKYSVAVTPGLQVLEASQPTLAPQQRALVAGASEGNRLLGLPALPAVRKEIQQIESALPQTEILLDQDFSEAALQDLIQGQAASIIHIATHGQFSSNPDETFIVTGTGERLDLADLGNLLRQRTQSQSQALELLFLSACQTLAGDRWAALGMAGVAIRSGAQSTIASIWNADDEASAELVSRFYHHLTATTGQTKAEALRLTQVEMLTNPRYDLPVYWSPYVLIGNWQ